LAIVSASFLLDFNYEEIIGLTALMYDDVRSYVVGGSAMIESRRYKLDSEVVDFFFCYSVAVHGKIILNIHVPTWK